MDCEKELGCSAAELRARLSRHLDGELSGAEAEALEEHLKSCERCRAELAELRGADRAFERALQGPGADPGFVARVMAAILGRRGGTAGGRPVAGPVLWLVVAIAAAGAGTLVTLGVQALRRRGELETRALGLRIGAPQAAAPGWRVRRPGREESLEAAPGSALAAGTELELAAGGGHGLVERGPELSLYVEAGSTLHVAPDADDERGLALVSGRVFLKAAALERPFELRLGEAGTVRPGGRGSALLVEAEGRGFRVTVVSGSATVSTRLFERALGPSDRLSLGIAGSPPVVARADTRALDLRFVPARLRPSAWPSEGGSARRDGCSPFPASLPPVLRASVGGVSGVSAAVLAGDDTVFFLAGPAPGRLVGVRGSAVVASVRLRSAFVGDPAIGPDGRVYVSTREAGLLAASPEDPALELAQVVPPDPLDPLRYGPVFAPDGAIVLVSSSGVSLHEPDGALRWRVQGVAASAPPAVGPEGRVVVPALSGRLHVLDAASGRDLAQGVPPVDEAFLARAAVAPDGTAWAVSARRYLVRLASDLSSGRIALPEADYALPPAVGPDGTVFVASSSGTVLKLPRGAAMPTVFYEAGERIVQGPLVDGAGEVLLWTASGRLVSVEPAGRARLHDLGARDPAPACLARDGALVFVTRDGRVFGK